MNWKENITKDYFILLKYIGMVILLGMSVLRVEEGPRQKAGCIFISVFFLIIAIAIEWMEGRKSQLILSGMEGILALVAVFLFPTIGNYFILIWILDGISIGKRKAYAYFLGYLSIFLFWKTGAGILEGIAVSTFLIVTYIQEKIVIRNYRELVEENERTEGQLKSNMEKENQNHSEALEKSRMKYENEMLEEKNRIAQALHDKLGHSINGSLYQLEAAKLLATKKPQECQKILQEVIEHLRGSMDEIRILLRRERPDRKRKAVLSLQLLCAECEEKYGIHTDLSLSDEAGRITEPIWEIILDNTFEAVTNALKYAECHNLSITIQALNEVVRCSISDDGKGAATFKEGMGIAGMTKRVRDVRGYIDIESEIGFTINMILPLNK